MRERGRTLEVLRREVVAGLVRARKEVERDRVLARKAVDACRPPRLLEPRKLVVEVRAESLHRDREMSVR